MINYQTIKKALFIFQPETAHAIVEAGLRTLPFLYPLNNYLVKKNFRNNDILQQNILGMNFQNPIGLAPGFDKNGTMIKAMPSLGFGFTEIGTITPLSQKGNDKPRLHRFVEQKSIQNAMGFNNLGAIKISNNVKKCFPFILPIGANIGKNKTTTQEEAINDYKTLMSQFKDISDYLVINISSPNTPSLRDLQNEDFIKEIFVEAKKITNKPVFLKIAPDMNVQTAISLCRCAIEFGANGIIATNTTTDYTLLEKTNGDKGLGQKGGISGNLLQDKSSKFFKSIAKELFGETILISVGGISDAKEAYKRIKNGASLVQIYSALVFEGPSMCKNINEELVNLLKKDGYTNISQAIGVDLNSSN